MTLQISESTPLAYEYTCVPVYVSYGIEVQDATRTRGGWIEISGGSLYVLLGIGNHDVSIL